MEKEEKGGLEEYSRRLEECTSRLVDELVSVFRASRAFPSPEVRLTKASRLIKSGRELLSVSPLPLSLEMIMDLERAVEKTERQMERFAQANHLDSGSVSDSAEEE